MKSKGKTVCDRNLHIKKHSGNTPLKESLFEQRILTQNSNVVMAAPEWTFYFPSFSNFAHKTLADWRQGSFTIHRTSLFWCWNHLGPKTSRDLQKSTKQSSVLPFWCRWTFLSCVEWMAALVWSLRMPWWKNEMLPVFKSKTLSRQTGLNFHLFMLHQDSFSISIHGCDFADGYMMLLLGKEKQIRSCNHTQYEWKYNRPTYPVSWPRKQKV